MEVTRVTFLGGLVHGTSALPLAARITRTVLPSYDDTGIAVPIRTHWLWSDQRFSTSGLYFVLRSGRRDGHRVWAYGRGLHGDCSGHGRQLAWFCKLCGDTQESRPRTAGTSI